MKERNRYASTVACTVAVQLFALAAFFCIYALISGGVFYSLSEEMGKVIAISLCGAVSAGLVVLNIMCVIKSRKVYITRPDSIAIKDSAEVVRIAYTTARPVLIHKITLNLILVSLAPVVYIILLTCMSDQALATIYGKITASIIVAFAFLFSYPCFDRIACYRALLNETHELYYDTKEGAGSGYVFAVAAPVSICIWYVMRYYSRSGNIAWIVFPMTVLFGAAVAFLCNWSKNR